MWRSLRCERESATSWRANFALGVVAAARGEAFLLRRGDGDRETLDIVLASLLDLQKEAKLRCLKAWKRCKVRTRNKKLLFYMKMYNKANFNGQQRLGKLCRMNALELL